MKKVEDLSTYPGACSSCHSSIRSCLAMRCWCVVASSRSKKWSLWLLRKAVTPPCRIAKAARHCGLECTSHLDSGRRIERPAPVGASRARLRQRSGYFAANPAATAPPISKPTRLTGMSWNPNSLWQLANNHGDDNTKVKWRTKINEVNEIYTIQEIFGLHY